MSDAVSDAVSDGATGSLPDRMPPTLVIVDDEVDHAAIIQHLIGDMAPRLPVEVMTDAVDLLERLTAVPEHALALLDRLIEGREVYGVLTELRAARPDLTLAVLSAALSEEDRQRALRAGADHAAQKPGSLADWRALLRSLLHLSEDRRGAVA